MLPRKLPPGGCIPSDGTPRRRGTALGALLLVTVVAALLQLGVAVLSLHVLSWVRAYAVGESLYSKGQKDALLHAVRYVEHGREEDYLAFTAALVVPQGDGIARAALLKTPPDKVLARLGFLQGGNHLEDVDGIIGLFVWTHDTWLMRDAVQAWSEGDAVIADLERLMAGAHGDLSRGVRSFDVEQLHRELPYIGERLAILERLFLESLGTTSREVVRLLVALNFGFTFCLVAAGAVYAWRTWMSLAESDRQLEALRQQEKTRMVEENRHLTVQLHTDFLTGLPNRQALEALLLARSQDALAGPYGVLFIDLDGFKAVNDVHGHHSGDELLRIVARRLSLAVRSEDFVARVSGDEFVVVSQCGTHRLTTERLAARVLSLFREPCDLGSTRLCISASIGIAFCPDDAADPRALLIQADAAMYRIKRTSKDGVGEAACV